MALVALLSNPKATGNRSQLPAMRDYCARHPDIFHYEVEEVGQIARALATIARVKPKVLVINGGDGTVQAALTELYHGNHFEGGPPPVAVLPNGKTNLIALDLGAGADPIAALDHVLNVARGDMSEHIVVRELIALSNGGGESAVRPVLGMFLGGAGLAETILYCRHKIYPLGLPNGLSHVIAFMGLVLCYLFGMRARFLPQRGSPVRISFIRGGELQGSFAVLIVTTLEKLLLGVSSNGAAGGGQLRMMAIDGKPGAVMRAFFGYVRGRLGNGRIDGVHLGHGDVIRIEGEDSSVILDGEIFRTGTGRPIELRSTQPVPFLKIAA